MNDDTKLALKHIAIIDIVKKILDGDSDEITIGKVKFILRRYSDDLQFVGAIPTPEGGINKSVLGDLLRTYIELFNANKQDDEGRLLARNVLSCFGEFMDMYKLYAQIPHPLYNSFLKDLDDMAHIYTLCPKKYERLDMAKYAYIPVAENSNNDIVDRLLNYVKCIQEKRCIRFIVHSPGNKPVKLKTRRAVYCQKRYIFVETNVTQKIIREKFLTNADRIYGDIIAYASAGYPLECVKLYGNARMIYGDVSHINGRIHEDLYGDVSGLVGDITGCVGCATGVKINLDVMYPPWQKRPNIIDISGHLKNILPKEFTLLSNEDNNILMKVWSCLAHQTIGITDEERALFDHPVKVKPPFEVDRWGRAYRKKSENELIVYSVNPADIMLAKDVNKCSTCFCLHSESHKWPLGMKCLIALNSVNPNLGVAFVIRKDAIKRLNQFDKIKFKWYDPEQATFFQYDSKSMWCWNGACFNKITRNEVNEKNVQRIYGHDGYNLDHDRQEHLAYLETFTKPNWRWYRGDNADFPLVNNNKDFTMDDIPDDWKRQVEIANAKAEELLAFMKNIEKGE